ncbi:hypothetical protein Bca52824_076277 [Brassica carinata]|uniref:Uncharacterized protein n=2 Tax=Brassica TaxID=3705 RepID=A0A8X7PUU2_BRACI|nr:hypothetical protein Bca52824_076277 [Brassica carinata]
MAPKSTERALNFRKQQRRLLFLSIARTCKNLRSDHKDRDPQRMPANTYLEQQANVHALAGLKIENSTVEKAPSQSISAGAVSGAPHCADTSDMLKLREYMRKLVLNTLQQYKPCPADDASKAKYMTVARRLEQMLFKMAISKEEYMNPSTLESRIASLIKGKQLNNYNKRRTNSSLVGKMAPTTTGLSHAGASAGLGPSGNTVGPMDHDVLELREYMRTLVFSELHKHHPCPADDASKAKYLHVSRRLEEGIYQMANTKAHMSGQLSGQDTNQGTVSSQNNGNSQMHNLAVASSGAGGGEGPSRSTVGPIDHDILRLRQYMQILVFNVLKQKQPPPFDAASKAKYMDVARRLEEGLFKTAISKEDYLNESTLESRLGSLIKGRLLKNSNQGHTNSSMVGTMAPTTTGLSHAGGNSSSMVTSSACASVGLGPSPNTSGPMDHDVLELRQYMRTLVFNELHKRRPCPADAASDAKFLDIARHLEEGLFQMANTREDYLNQSTLVSRLAALISRRIPNNQQNANSSPPGTMTTLAPEVSPMQVREKLPENEDELETEITENLKSMSLYS